ncbi:MAG: hypothetical protein ACI8ZW_000129 [Yoonia sp.]|jgi:hypothetical protein
MTVQSTEQHTVRTGAHKDQLGCSRLVDQKPIGRDMTFRQGTKAILLRLKAVLDSIEGMPLGSMS